MRKIRKTKKGVSEMVSYVILISIAIGLAVSVYAWLKIVSITPQEPNCNEGTSVIITEYKCYTDNSVINHPGIEFTIKNNGYFNVSGIVVSVSDDPQREPIYNIIDRQTERLGMTGYYFFAPSLAPGDEKSVSFSNSINSYTNQYLEKFVKIQIQPFIITSINKRVFCKDAIIKQDLEGCCFINC